MVLQMPSGECIKQVLLSVLVAILFWFQFYQSAANNINMSLVEMIIPIYLNYSVHNKFVVVLLSCFLLTPYIPPLGDIMTEANIYQIYTNDLYLAHYPIYTLMTVMELFGR